MFSAVQNRGGRASCQEDPDTFKTIRTSNFMTWSEATLKSYLTDLEEAVKQDRNLMTEKYGRMEGLLSPVKQEVLQLIDEIVKIECKWTEEFMAKYPKIRLARPLYSSQDTPDVVSSETYARGELQTYSEKTIKSYYQDTLEMKSKKLNRIEMAIINMTKRFSGA